MSNTWTCDAGKLAGTQYNGGLGIVENTPFAHCDDMVNEGVLIVQEGLAMVTTREADPMMDLSTITCEVDQVAWGCEPVHVGVQVTAQIVGLDGLETSVVKSITSFGTGLAGTTELKLDAPVQVFGAHIVVISKLLESL